MITKGTIEKIIDDYSAKVRLPIYDGVENSQGSTSEKNLSEAAICLLPNSNVRLVKGDVVYVAFEDDDIGKPVIIGWLQKSTGNTSDVGLVTSTLTTTSTTILDNQTYIGNVKPSEIQTLQGARDNLQAQIDILSSSIPAGGEFVTLDTTQIVSGQKTWTNSNNVYNISEQSDNSEKNILITSDSSTNTSIRKNSKFTYNPGSSTLTTENVKITGNITNGTESKTVKEIVDAINNIGDIPTKTSQLQNDGDGTSPYVTKKYVDDFKPEWGNITGELNNQTDLKNALDEKLDKITSSSVDLRTYGIDLLGNQVLYTLTNNYKPSTLMYRDSNGKSLIMTPSPNDDANTIINIEYAKNNLTELTYTNTELAKKLDSEKANLNIVKDFNVVKDGDNVYLAINYRNLSTESETDGSRQLELASDTQAGLMSISDYKQIRDNTSKIEQLQNSIVRLLYTEKSNPTADDINNFVIGLGYQEPFGGIAVLVDHTKHIWHYYDNDIGWRDDGTDTVSQFTNTNAGIIKGAEIDGKVYAETDGTGSIYGWGALKESVNLIKSQYLKTASVTNDVLTITKQDNTTVSFEGGSKLKITMRWY